MTLHACTCGYQAESPEDLLAHFGEMFIPADDVAPDGQVHAEVAQDKDHATVTQSPPILTCRCGISASIDDFDQHLTDVFTPADHIGLDGKHHAPAPSGT